MKNTKIDYGFPSETMLEKKYLRRKRNKRPNFIDWFFIFLVLVILTLLGQVIEKYKINPFMPEKVEAHMSDLQVHETYQGQTREYCKTFLATN